MPNSEPGRRVRVVVTNYNGRDLVVRSVEQILASDWPPGDLQVVLVDNASTDGSADEVVRRHPAVQLRRSPINLGFAGGSNLGMRDLHGVDYVALVNNDAFVDGNWLKPLVEALEGDERAGAACPKIVFEPRFADVRIETEGFVPGAHDPRTLGVAISGVRVAGSDWGHWPYYLEGFHPVETPPADGSGEPQYRWSEPTARVWLPAARDDEAGRVELRLAAEREKDVTFLVGGRRHTITVGARPAWHALELGDALFDVVNSAGSVLIADGSGADRGFWEPDDGRFDQPDEVFAWCGAAVLLSARYLREVGLFDDRHFMYYEDFDLSWRGRARGWRYLYVPESKVVHVHAASAVEGSALFEHYVQRNRLLTLVKNAPWGLVLRQVTAYLRELRRVRTAPVNPYEEDRRRRSGFAFVKHLPAALVARGRNRLHQEVPRRELMRWSAGQRAGGRRP